MHKALSRHWLASVRKLVRKLPLRCTDVSGSIATEASDTGEGLSSKATKEIGQIGIGTHKVEEL
ncbi:MAG: hypothetical protein AAFQ63_07330 [Cyanobacteria bacterium J06621_11]